MPSQNITLIIITEYSKQCTGSHYGYKCLNKSRSLHEETAAVLRRRLVAKTPDDLVIVVSIRKVSKRNIECLNGCK